MSLAAANFHDVYQRHSGDVYRFAFYLTCNPALADDLTAEAFLRLWASPVPAQLQTVKSYLFAIVRNLYVQNWRTGRRDAPLADRHAVHPPVDHAIDKKAELARVLDALGNLEQLERAALLLRSEHGLSYDDIARILDLTPVAARVKVHRARQKLMPARNLPQNLEKE